MPSLRHTFRELRRRRVFRSLAAYLVAGWVLLQVGDVTLEPLGAPDWAQRALIIAVVAGAVPVAVLSWLYDLRRGRLVRTPAGADPAAASSTPAAFVERRASAKPALPTPVVAGPTSGIASVAILPFDDLSQARDQDWFCDGLAEEIIDSLCCVRGLRVASRTASFRFRGGGTDPREIGRQLGVDAVLEGSVRKAGERLRISAKLVDTETGYQRWGNAYERQLEDVFAIQADIARHVADALKVNLADPALARNQRHAPATMEAYEFYLRGRQQFQQLSESTGRHAADMFRRAIELDPNYAPALAGLADALVLLIQWRFVRPEDVLPEARAAADKALALAPDLAEAQVAQANVLSLGGDDAGATRAYEHAISLNPGLYEAWYFYGRHCFSRGQAAQAAEYLQQAWRIRPDESSVLALAVSAIDATGDAAGATAMARRALEGLRKQMALEPENPRVRYMASGVLLRLGEREEGLRLADEALALRPNDFSTMYNVACSYCLAGELDRALELLERAVERGGFVGWMLHDPDITVLRDSPRFQRIMASLDARAATAP
jgi:adenylate cyclase